MNCRELNDDVPRTSKDTGHMLTNHPRTIFTNATAVASTTDNNYGPVSPVLSSVIAASLLPLSFNEPPIASLEDLTNGEQSNDITSARGNLAAVSATTANRDGIRRSHLKGYFLDRLNLMNC